MIQPGLETVDALQMQLLLPGVRLPRWLPDHSSLDVADQSKLLGDEVERIIPAEYHEESEIQVEYGVNLGTTAVRVSLNNDVWTSTSGVGKHRERLLHLTYPVTPLTTERVAVRSITFGTLQSRSHLDGSYGEPVVFLGFEERASADSGLSVVGLSAEDAQEVRGHASEQAVTELWFHAGHMEENPKLQRAWGIGAEALRHIPEDAFAPVEAITDLYSIPAAK